MMNRFTIILFWLLSSWSFGQEVATVIYQVYGQSHKEFTDLSDSQLQLETKLIMKFKMNHTGKMPDNFGDIRNVETLVIQCDSITDLSEKIGDLINLKELYIEAPNLLKTLPESIGKLDNLEVLVINPGESGGIITSLPESIGKLKSLRYLELFSTRLTRLPSSFKNLDNLRQLHLSCWAIEEFPQEIIQLKNGLSELEFFMPKMESLPDNFSEIKLFPGEDRGYIKLDNAHKLKNLPKGIRSMPFQLHIDEAFTLNNLNALNDSDEYFELFLSDLKSKRQLNRLLRTINIDENLALALPGILFNPPPRSIYKLTNLQRLTLVDGRTGGIELKYLKKLKDKLSTIEIEY